MTNQKSQTIRKIGQASTSSIFSPTRTCLPHAENGTALSSESRITHLSSMAPLPKEDHPSPGHQPSTNNHPPTARKVSRNGKIARLSKPLRDMVNLMLQNNISHPKIVEAWMHSLQTIAPSPHFDMLNQSL